MGFNWFRKKKETEDTELLNGLVDYIVEARNIGYKDKQILAIFYERGYDIEIIQNAFSIADTIKPKIREVKKMKKPQEEIEEDDEEQEEVEEDDSEEEEEKPRKIEKTKPKETAELTGEQINSVLGNHEARISAIEAWIFRVKSQ